MSDPTFAQEWLAALKQSPRQADVKDIEDLIDIVEALESALKAKDERIAELIKIGNEMARYMRELAKSVQRFQLEHNSDCIYDDQGEPCNCGLEELQAKLKLLMNK